MNNPTDGEYPTSSGDERSLVGEALRAEMAKMRDEVQILRSRPDDEETKIQVAALRQKMLRMREEVQELHRLQGGSSLHDSDLDPPAQISDGTLENELSDATADTNALLRRLETKDADQDAERLKRESQISTLDDYRKLLEQERERNKVQEIELREAHKQVREAWVRAEQLENMVRVSGSTPNSEIQLNQLGSAREVGAADSAGGLGETEKASLPSPPNSVPSGVPSVLSAGPSQEMTRDLPSARDSARGMPSARSATEKYSQLSARRPARSCSPAAVGHRGHQGVGTPIPTTYPFRPELTQPVLPTQYSYPYSTQIASGSVSGIPIAIPGTQPLFQVPRFVSASSSYAQEVPIFMKGGGQEMASVPGGPDAAGGQVGIAAESPAGNGTERVESSENELPGTAHARVRMLEKRVAALRDHTDNLERRARETSVERLTASTSNEIPPTRLAASTLSPVVRMTSAPRGRLLGAQQQQPFQVATPRPQMSPLGARNRSPSATRVIQGPTVISDVWGVPREASINPSIQTPIPVDEVLGKARQALQEFDRIQGPPPAPSPSPPPRSNSFPTPVDPSRIAGGIKPWAYGTQSYVQNPAVPNVAGQWGVRSMPQTYQPSAAAYQPSAAAYQPSAAAYQPQPSAAAYQPQTYQQGSQQQYPLGSPVKIGGVGPGGTWR